MKRADVDVLVIGGGVIGLACARSLASRGRSVVIAEREKTFGLHTSARNTGLIHAGVYYEPGTLKAKLCVRGRDRLYAYCRERGIAHRRIGKLFIVTRDEALPGLQKLYDRGLKNGVDDVEIIDGADIARREPAVTASAGVWCPQSGVVDTHELMLSLLGDAEAHGAIFSPSTEIDHAVFDGGVWRMQSGGEDVISASSVINASGLWGIELARRVFPNRSVPDAAPLKGAYLRLSGASPVRHAIYPDLNPGVILPRVDATPGLDGVLRFGPASDPATAADDYVFPLGLVDRLLPQIQAYLPSVRADQLTPDYVGVRPRIASQDAGPSDFVIARPEEPGWFDLWNMESPALTSSLAIAAHLATEMEKVDA